MKTIEVLNPAGVINNQKALIKVNSKAPKLVQLTRKVIQKRILDIVGNEKLQAAFKKTIQDIELQLKQHESCASSLKWMSAPSNNMWTRNICRSNKIHTLEEFLRVAFIQLDFQLGYYYEICEKPELSARTMQIGRYVLEVYTNIQGVAGVVLTAEIEKLIKEIKCRIGERVGGEEDFGLYYWPCEHVSFEKTMEELKDAGFLPDISHAKNVFKKFNNRGLKLKWEGSNRELMYFLLLLFGARNHNSETITEIAFKLFDFNIESTPASRKSFTTDLAFIEGELASIHEHRSKFTILYNIMNQKLELSQV